MTNIVEELKTILSDEVNRRLETIECKNYLDVHKLASEYYGEERVDFKISGVHETAMKIISRLSAAMTWGNVCSVLAQELQYSVRWDDDSFREICDGFTTSSEDGAKEHFAEQLKLFADDDFFWVIKHFANHVFNTIIHFPRVTVTNENGNSIKVQDLYAFIRYGVKGDLCDIVFSRSTYPANQFLANYMHSHVNWRNYDVLKKHTPCMGSGPIRNIYGALQSKPFAPAVWVMFYAELKRFVEVESLEGGPYRHLERINASLSDKIECNYMDRYHEPNSHICDEYIEALAKRERKKNPYKFVVRGNKIDFALTPERLLIVMSDDFNKWVADKSDLIRAYIKNMTVTASYDNGELHGVPKRIDKDNIDMMKRHDGMTMFYFKDKPVNLHITNIDALNKECAGIFRVLNKDNFAYIAQRILLIVNYNESKYQYSRRTGSTYEADQSGKRVIYL